MAMRCMGCMQMKNSSPVCEHCGFDEGQSNNSHQLPVGTIVGEQYLLGTVLGQGGFGITYIGWDRALKQRVAVKEFFPSGYAGRDTNSHEVTSYDNHDSHDFENNKQRFLREAESLAKLWDIPQIVRVLRHFEENGTAYIAMEYVEGVDLRKYMRQQGRPLSVEELFDILGPVMDALSHVHKAELVHRDISPDNIMVLPDGSAKLLDFGAARYVENANAEQDRNTSTQTILKHGFAPPEQYRSRGALGPWSDVYAMCATIYYCLTGRKPTEAMTRMIDDTQVGWNTVPGLTRQQRSVLEAGMALKPRDRIKSMADLYQALFSELLAVREKARLEAEEEKRRQEKKQRKEQALKEAEARRAEAEQQKKQARQEEQQRLSQEKRRKEETRQKIAQEKENQRREALKRKQESARKKEQERKEASEKKKRKWKEAEYKREEVQQEVRLHRESEKDKKARSKDMTKWLAAGVCAAVLLLAALWLMPDRAAAVPGETQAGIEAPEAPKQYAPGPVLIIQEQLEVDEVELGHRETVPVLSGHDPAKLNWTTSDPKVADVSETGDLIVTGHGNVEITAQWEDQIVSCAVVIYRKSNVACMYEENETGITITGFYFEGERSGEVVFPRYIDGKPVTAIDPLGYPEYVTSIIIQEGVTRIEDQVFPNWAGLTSVSLPSTLTFIGYGNFADCPNLVQVNIPDSVTYIGSRAFHGTKWLDNQTEDFVICGDGILIKYNGADEYVTIPNTVKQISDAFKDCENMLSVTIPDGVTAIDKFAFLNCRKLISVTIPDSVTTIGAEAFYGCSALENLSIPQTVTSIGPLALDGTPWLESQNGDFVIHNGILIHYKGKAAHVVIPSGVKTISGAFECNRTVESITIPDGVVAIGDRAFFSCENLTNVTIADTVTVIGDSSFSHCINLSNLNIPEGVTSIEQLAFSGCSGLTSLTIPGSVSSIDGFAFAECTGLTDVTISEGVSVLGLGMFSGCTGLTSVTIPGSVTTIENQAFEKCTGLREVILCPGIEKIGVYVFWDCTGLTNITLPGSVNVIEGAAFYGCRNLTSINIPGSVKLIEGSAFVNTGLTEVSVPSGCSVSPYAFPEKCKVIYR